MPLATAGELSRIQGNIEIVWKISDFISLTADENTIHNFKSPNFFFADASWYIKIDVHGKDDKQNGGYIGFYLVPDDLAFPLKLTYTLYLKNATGVILRKGKHTHTFTKEIGNGWPRFIQRTQLLSEISDFVPSGIVTLFCNVVEDTTNKNQSVDTLLQNLKRLFIEKENCDAVLNVEDSEFNVHRAILAARSPVFLSMFKHDSQEKHSGKVNIPDCSAVAFEVFLLYLYAASVDTISSNNVCEVYYTADKYQVTELKSECVEYMKNNMSDENFCATMTLSLQHNELGLQKKATSYFCDNVKTIIKTLQWQEYLRAYPSEANELYIKAINA